MAPGSPIETAPEPPSPRLARLRRRALRLADGLPASISGLLSWAPLGVAICLAPGITAVPVVVRQLEYLQTNRLPVPQRLLAGGVVVLSFLLLSFAYRVAVNRRVREGEAFAVAAARLNRLLSPVLFLPALLWMAPAGTEKARPFFELSLALAMALWAGVLAYRARPRERVLPAWAPAATAAILGLLYVATIGFYALRHHRALGTATYDLGIYDNVVWHSAHGRPLATSVLPAGTHLAGHFDPILVLIAPLYRLLPGAETLLVLQVIWLALGAVPLFLLARDVLGRPWAAATLCAVYLLHPSLHGANLFDFHSLTLAIPLLVSAVWLLHRRRHGAYAAVVLLLLLVREDVSLLLCFLGLWALLDGKPRAGLLTIAAAATWFVVVRALVLGTGPLNEGGAPGTHSFVYYYDALIPDAREGSAALLHSLLINPAFALAHALGEAKLLYLGVMFVPVLFLPLFAPRAGWLLAFGIGSTLLASKEAVYSPYYQYVTMVLPFALALTPLGLARLRDGVVVRALGLDRERLARAATVAMLVAAVVSTIEFGAILGNDSFRAGSRGLRRRWSPEVAERYHALQAAVARVGPAASVSATARVVPHVSAREQVSTFPLLVGADFLLLQVEDLDRTQKRRLDRLSRSGAYRLVERRGGLELWERVRSVPLP